LRQQLSAQQAQANAYAAQANDYQAKVNQLNGQIGVLQAQINLNQAKFNQVTAAIAENEAKLNSEKAILGADLKSMYVTDGVTPLEMIASSDNLSDYFNQEQYQDSIKNKIQDAMAQILALQQQLAEQKAQVSELLATEQGQKQQLADARAQVNQLLAVASQNAAAANAQVQSSNAQIAGLRAQQAAAIAAASHHLSGGGSGCGGYPAYWCNSAQDSIIDSWGMFNRECVSYAAWAAAIRFGHSVPYWGGHGNANQWPGNARGSGIPVDGSPRVGDVAIYMGGYYGHAMIVEQVKGGTVIVSSFNADNTGHYSVDEWSTGSLQFIHFR
jgi:surface antigen